MSVKQMGRLLPLTEVLLTLFCHFLLPSEKVSDPKTINIKQYLNTSYFSVNNRYCVMKSSQATQPSDFLQRIEKVSNVLCDI
jgi:hypothetical protein